MGNSTNNVRLSSITGNKMSNETCWTTHKHVVSQHCLRVFGIDNQIFFNREIKNRRKLGLKLGSPMVGLSSLVVLLISRHLCLYLHVCLTYSNFFLIFLCIPFTPFFQGKLSGYRPLRASTADPPKKIFNSSIFSS